MGKPPAGVSGLATFILSSITLITARDMNPNGHCETRDAERNLRTDRIFENMRNALMEPRAEDPPFYFGDGIKPDALRAPWAIDKYGFTLPSFLGLTRERGHHHLVLHFSQDFRAWETSHLLPKVNITRIKASSLPDSSDLSSIG